VSCYHTFLKPRTQCIKFIIFLNELAASPDSPLRRMLDAKRTKF